MQPPTLALPQNCLYQSSLTPRRHPLPAGHSRFSPSPAIIHFLSLCVRLLWIVHINRVTSQLQPSEWKSPRWALQQYQDSLSSLGNSKFILNLPSCIPEKEGASHCLREEEEGDGCFTGCVAQSVGCLLDVRENLDSILRTV